MRHLLAGTAIVCCLGISDSRGADLVPPPRAIVVARPAAGEVQPAYSQTPAKPELIAPPVPPVPAPAYAPPPVYIPTYTPPPTYGPPYPVSANVPYYSAPVYAPSYPQPGCSSANDKHAEAKSHFRHWLAQHRREPDGCPTPVGCGNAWTEFKFVFGSCRQFFGTGDASQGCMHKANLPSPPYQ